MKFKDDLDLLNSIAREKSNDQMIHQINQENPQLREMHTENMRLRVSLEDHQRALEHIMSKYREHTQLALNNSKLNLQELFKGETEKSMVCSHTFFSLYLFIPFHLFYFNFLCSHCVFFLTSNDEASHSDWIAKDFKNVFLFNFE